MSSPTPGPWVIPSKSHVGTRRCGVWSDDGRFQIAVCNSEALSWEANKANARLIAAAPELLRACQTFETWLRREEAGLPGGVVRDTPEGEARWREWYDENLRLCAEAQTQARAAIERATGGSHG